MLFAKNEDPSSGLLTSTVISCSCNDFLWSNWQLVAQEVAWLVSVFAPLWKLILCQFCCWFWIHQIDAQGIRSVFFFRAGRAWRARPTKEVGFKSHPWVVQDVSGTCRVQDSGILNSWALQANLGSDWTGAQTRQRKITASQPTMQLDRGSTTTKIHVGGSKLKMTQTARWLFVELWDLESLHKVVTVQNVAQLLGGGSSKISAAIWSRAKVLALRSALWEEDFCFNDRIVKTVVVWVEPSPDYASIVWLTFVSIATSKRMLSGVWQSSCMLFWNDWLLLLVTSAMEAFVVEKESNVSQGRARVKNQKGPRNCVHLTWCWWMRCQVRMIWWPGVQLSTISNVEPWALARRFIKKIENKRWAPWMN